MPFKSEKQRKYLQWLAASSAGKAPKPDLEKARNRKEGKEFTWKNYKKGERDWKKAGSKKLPKVLDDKANVKRRAKSQELVAKAREKRKGKFKKASARQKSKK